MGLPCKGPCPSVAFAPSSSQAFEEEKARKAAALERARRLLAVFAYELKHGSGVSGFRVYCFEGGQEACFFRSVRMLPCCQGSQIGVISG